MKRKSANIVCFASGRRGHLRAQCQHYVNVLEAGATPDPDPPDDNITPEVEDDRATARVLWSVNKVTKACRRVHSRLDELSVSVSYSGSPVYRLLAVADTGAECCVAGLDQMRALQLTEGKIDPTDADLRHAGGGALKVLGSKICCLRVRGRATTAPVYFVRGVKRLFLSIAACKALNLVHANFPHHTRSPHTGAAVKSVTTGGSETHDQSV